jgi:serine/alanine adding enzyme
MSLPSGWSQLTPTEDPDKWDEYVMRHPQGCVFHTSWMARAYAETPYCKPFALAICNSESKVIALLSAVRVSLLPGIASPFTSRSIQYGEPLCQPTPEGERALLQLINEHDRVMCRQALFGEVRPINAPGHEYSVLERANYGFKEYLNYVVDVSRDSATLWSVLSKSTRQKIQRSFKRGIEVTQGSTHADIDRMYSLVKKSYQRSKVALVDVRLFHAALDYFPKGVVQVRLATYQGTDVAAGLGLIFRERFYAWYGGSLRIPEVAPFDCLTWEEIRFSSNRGLRYYDFGGAGWPEEEYGPRDFKAKFKGDLVCYGRYRRVYAPWRLKAAEKGYCMIRSLLHRLRNGSAQG